MCFLNKYITLSPKKNFLFLPMKIRRKNKNKQINKYSNSDDTEKTQSARYFYFSRRYFVSVQALKYSLHAHTHTRSISRNIIEGRSNRGSSDTPAKKSEIEGVWVGQRWCRGSYPTRGERVSRMDYWSESWGRRRRGEGIEGVEHQNKRNSRRSIVIASLY